jgi:glucokinase
MIEDLDSLIRVVERNKDIKLNELQEIYVFGDLGATNSRMGAAGKDSKGVEHIVQIAIYPSKKLYEREPQRGNFLPVLEHFIRYAGLDDRKIKKIVLAPAGPTLNGRVNMTHANFYVLDTYAEIINDFAAQGEALKACLEGKEKLQILDLRKLEYVDVAAAEKKGNMTLFGPGSGCGETRLILDKETGIYTVISSEGGHKGLVVDITDNDEIRIAKWLMRFEKGESGKPTTYLPRVESALSGSGFTHVFEYFINPKSFGRLAFAYLMSPENPKYSMEACERIQDEIERYKLLRDNEKPAFIASRAKMYPGTVFEKATDYIYKHIGIAARNSAVHELATGGVVIGGGIMPKDIFLPGSDRFDKRVAKQIVYAFENSGATHNEMIKEIPLYLIMDDLSGLKGAKHKAMNG